MRIIVCTDENNGILFNNRRVSKDSILMEYIKKIMGDNTIILSNYSAELFKEHEINNYLIDETIISSGKGDNLCFIEDVQPNSDEEITDIYICNWNRTYPTDTKFMCRMENYKQISSEDIEGSSHKITMNHYIHK